LSLVSAVPSQEIGWEERLQNDLDCVKCDVKPYLNQSMLFRLRGWPAFIMCRCTRLHDNYCRVNVYKIKRI